MMKLLLGGAAAITLAAGIAPALAQVSGAAPVAQVQQRAERVHTRAEIAGRVQALFARLDANRDGVVVRDEAQAARGAKRAQRAGGQRGAGNPAAAFDRIDRNRDGMISRDEFAARTAGREQRQAAGGQRGRGERGGMAGMGRMGGMGLAGRMFDAADANRDSRVTLPEASAAAFARFDRADVNRDGRLTPAERRQGRGRG